MKTIVFFLTLIFVEFLFSQNNITICQYCDKKAFQIANIELLDTTIINKDCTKFRLKKIAEPVKTALILDTINYTVFPFWLEPEISEIYINISHCKEREIEIVSPSNLNILENYANKYNDYLVQLCEGNENKKFDSLFKIYLRNSIIKNSDNYFSLYNLDILKHRDSVGSILDFLSKIDSSLFHYSLYKSLHTYCNNSIAKRNIKVGDEVKFYEIKNAEGLKYMPTNKPKLLFVWTSTCGPCKKDIPKLILLQKIYKHVEFVFVALDENADSWKKKYEQYQIPPNNNFIDTTNTSGKFFQSTTIYAYPTYIMLNAENKLISKNEGADELKWVEGELEKLRE